MFSLKKTNKLSLDDNRTSQNPKILDVNLIKDEVKVVFNWDKNLSILFIVLVLTGLFITEIYFGLDWWEKQEIKQSQSMDNQVVELGKELNQLKAKNGEVLVFKDKNVLTGQLLEHHVYWSNFFNWLERNTLSTVIYKSFSGDLYGKYSVGATANNFAEVSWQAKAFLKDPLVQSVDITMANSSASQKPGGDKVSFSLNFVVNPNIFKK